MQGEYKAAYEQLNKEQKQAVDQIDGPVLVVAGPGTGKTQLLSLRVANILKKTDTDASSVLCLTFTNFAAANMRERLNKLIGSESLNVNVQTFHSFAADIMNMYPEYFWNGAPLTIAPDTVQLNTLQTVLSNLPATSPLSSKFNGKFTAFNDIQTALKLTKEAGLTPDKLQTMIAINQEYIDTIEPQLAEILTPALSYKKLDALKDSIDALPEQAIDSSIAPLKSLGTVLKEELAAAIEADQGTEKTTETGKWKKRWIQSENGAKKMSDERRRNHWWLEFIEVYKAYRTLLHSSGYYDYSDMIVEVIAQLESNSDLRAMVQERFLYILIDEFQDTNAAQLRLAHLIASYDGDEQSPNLMAVGDDDQTIYAFNGAELNNMLFFKNNYPSTKLIVLKDNYRSHQTVLDTSTKIISQAEDRMVKRDPEMRKDLFAKTDIKKGVIKHDNYPTREHQFHEVARHVKQLWQDNPEASIAVLASKHESLVGLSSQLNKLEVPIRYEQQNDVLDSEIVKQICLIAETVQAITDGQINIVNENLASMLRHPMWEIDTYDLWELAVANQKNPNWLKTLKNHDDQNLAVIANWLMELSKESIHQPLQIIIQDILGLDTESEPISPIRRYFLINQKLNNDYLLALSACNTILDLTRELAGVRKKAHLKDFVNFIELSRDLEKRIVDQSWFMSGENAVQLMTVYKAKGLEFDTVFLVDAVEDNWKPRRSKKKSPANLPLQAYGEVYDDYVRLMYVAATRARHSFIVSSYSLNNQGKEMLSTPLLSQAIIPREVKAKDLPESQDVLETALEWPRLKKADERTLLKDRLDNFKLTATSLYQFLDIEYGGPRAFLVRGLLRVPERQSVEMAYGNAMHAAMQTAQYLTTDGELSLSSILKAYQTSLDSQAITQKDIEAYQEKGRLTLEKVFTDFGFKLPPTGKAELPIREVFIGDAKLGGKLDHFFEDEDSIMITDYKTGKPLTSFTTKDQTKMIKAWRYRTQLDFYALLAKKYLPSASKKKIMTRIAFLESDNEKGLFLPHEPNGEDMDRLEKLISIVWNKIMDLDFPDTSQYSADIEGVEQFINDLLSGKI